MRKPSPAMIVAIIALIIACVGTAVAGVSGLAGINQVKSQDIAPGAVKSSDLGKAAVTERAVAEAAIASQKIAKSAVGGAEVAQNSLTGEDIRKNSITGADLLEKSLSIPATERGSDAYFDQPPAQQSISGGPGIVANQLTGVPAGSYAIVWSARVVRTTDNGLAERLECGLSAGQDGVSYYKVRFPPNDNPTEALVFDEAMMSGVATLDTAGDITVICDSIAGEPFDLNQRNLYAIRLVNAIAK